MCITSLHGTFIAFFNILYHLLSLKLNFLDECKERYAGSLLGNRNTGCSDLGSTLLVAWDR